MTAEKKSRVKPIFKQILLLQENIQENDKVLKFKRKKWKRFIQQYSKKLTRFGKFKSQDQTRYLVTKYPTRKDSYNQRYKIKLNCFKKLSLFYGGLPQKFLKQEVKLTLKNSKTRTIDSNTLLLSILESRIDIVLYRAKFCKSIKSATQLVIHGKIAVNGETVKSRNYRLKEGDLITLKQNWNSVVKENIRQMPLFFSPPKHLHINYKTMQILMGNTEYTGFLSHFALHLQLEKIMLSSFR